MAFLLPNPYEKVLFKVNNYYGVSWYVGELMLDLNQKTFFYADFTSENGKECINRIFNISDVECFAYVEDVKCTNVKI